MVIYCRKATPGEFSEEKNTSQQNFIMEYNWHNWNIWNIIGLYCNKGTTIVTSEKQLVLPAISVLSWMFFIKIFIQIKLLFLKITIDGLKLLKQFIVHCSYFVHDINLLSRTLSFSTNGSDLPGCLQSFGFGVRKPLSTFHKELNTENRFFFVFQTAVHVCYFDGTRSYGTKYPLFWNMPTLPNKSHHKT